LHTGYRSGLSSYYLIMNPKQKAREIYTKMLFEISLHIKEEKIAKEIAIHNAHLAANEIVESVSDDYMMYWINVKKELLKIKDLDI
jgi:hypothetical protein